MHLHGNLDIIPGWICLLNVFELEDGKVKITYKKKKKKKMNSFSSQVKGPPIGTPHVQNVIILLVGQSLTITLLNGHLNKNGSIAASVINMPACLLGTAVVF